ncbi:hypothetical protein RIF29_40160 [Crotalaria pallida]|uniref:Uncharacterized protein n=1 Tax=Crotalaria pallida TaxID=3830 RepID=A0AAN9E488_CROPI
MEEDLEGNNSNSKTQGNSCVSILTPKSGNKSNSKTQGNSCGSFLMGRLLVGMMRLMSFGAEVSKMCFLS